MSQLVDCVSVVCKEEPESFLAEDDISNYPKPGSVKWQDIKDDPFPRRMGDCYAWMFHLNDVTCALKEYPTGQPIEEVFWRSIMTDNEHNEQLSIPISDFIECVHELTEHDIPGMFMNAEKMQALESLSGSNSYKNTIRRTLVPIQIGFASCTAILLLSNRGYTRSKTITKWLLSAVVLLSLPFLTDRLRGAFNRSKFIWSRRRTQFNHTDTADTNNLLIENGAQSLASVKEDFKASLHHFDSKLKVVLEMEEKMKATSQRRYCITEKGYVAWMPKKVQEGDAIYIFEGSRLPFLMRRMKNVGGSDLESYELVGDCYLHGLMRGPGIYGVGGEKRKIRII